MEMLVQHETTNFITFCFNDSCEEGFDKGPLAPQSDFHKSVLA